MRLTIATEDDQIVNVEVDDSDTLQTLHAILEAETGTPSASQLLTAGDRPLTALSSTLIECQLANGDVLSLMRINEASDRAGGNGSSARGQEAVPSDPHQFLHWIRSQPTLMTQLRQGGNPPLLNAVEAGDGRRALDIFEQIQKSYAENQRNAERERQEETDLWNADPMDMEAQKKIAERINQQQIQHTYEQAWENNPEIFTQVDMLYVEFEVNRHKVAAFVDSGAQSTIVGLQTAQTLGIAHLIDKRFAGVAKGVGVGTIVGRIHQAPMRVGGEYLATSLTVMANDDMPFLFGLDMMRRHQVQIDLKDNQLRFTHLTVSLPFLAPHQISSETIGRPRTPESKQQARQHGESQEAAATGVGAPPAARAAGAAAAARASTASTAVNNRGAASGAAASGEEQDAIRRQAAALVSSLAATQPPSTSATTHQPVSTQQDRAPTGGVTSAAAPKISGSSTTGNHSDKVKQLMALGFTRPQVEDALSVCDGNMEQAAGLLYNF